MRHPDLKLQVEKLNRTTSTFETFDEAAGLAVAISASTGETTYIDVLCWSEEGAHVWGGDDAVERYREDPKASIFERIQIKAESLGRIP